jgi:hypothetical protein
MRLHEMLEMEIENTFMVGQYIFSRHKSRIRIPMFVHASHPLALQLRDRPFHQRLAPPVLLSLDFRTTDSPVSAFSSLTRSLCRHSGISKLIESVWQKLRFFMQRLS